jgi:hypothetical protein
MAGQQQGSSGRRAVREARLADKLRQNLGRRKAKARALRDTTSEKGDDGTPRGGSSEHKP